MERKGHPNSVALLRGMDKNHFAGTCGA
jgi:hypothetical protein